MFGWSTGPWGSKREKVKTSMNSLSGTPYWRPSDTEIAKQFMIDRKAAPSLARSTKISPIVDRKSTRLNSSHMSISYAVFCLKKKKKKKLDGYSRCSVN